MTKIEKVNEWFLKKTLPAELRALYLMGDKQIVYEKENSWLVAVKTNGSHFEFWCPNLEKSNEGECQYES